MICEKITAFMLAWGALVSGAMHLPLTAEVFVADNELRDLHPFMPSGAPMSNIVLRSACAVLHASTPSYRLTYSSDGDEEVSVCAWRPWRVGTFLFDEGDACECPRKLTITD